MDARELKLLQAQLALEQARGTSVSSIPFYSTDVGRLGPYGNITGQPNSAEGGKEMMYPSSARTKLVLNPFYREGGPLPQYVPSDLLEQYGKTLLQEKRTQTSEPNVIGAATDPQFYRDMGDKLMQALKGGVQDVFPTKPYENIYNRARSGEKNVLSTEWQTNPQLRDAVLNTALAALTAQTPKPNPQDFWRKFYEQNPPKIQEPQPEKLRNFYERYSSNALAR